MMWVCFNWIMTLLFIQPSPLTGWPDFLPALSTPFPILWTAHLRRSYIKFYRDRQIFPLLRPFLGGRMRFVAIQTHSTTGHHFLKTISLQYLSFYLTAWVISCSNGSHISL